MSLLASFVLANLIQSLGEGLYDMKPVDRDMGLREVLGNTVEERL